MQASPEKAPIYVRPIAGQPVTSIIVKAAKTPRIRVKFSNVITPFRYPNSPSIDRWSVTTIFNPNEKEHADFIATMEKLEGKENVNNSKTLKDDVIKDREGQLIQTGNFIMKFQTREKIPVIVMKPGFPQVPAELQQELAYGDEVIIEFDVIKYSKKTNTNEIEKGLSYQPKKIWLYPYEGEAAEQNRKEAQEIADTMQEFSQF